MPEVAAAQAAWIGVSDAELPALRRDFRQALYRAVAAALPSARVRWEGYGTQLVVSVAGRRPVTLWEPNWFWDTAPEADRIARAVSLIRDEIGAQP